MDIDQIPIWECIFTLPSTIIRNKTFLFLSKTKFDGERKESYHEHILQFIIICINHSITNEVVLWSLLAFTFKGWVKKWLQYLPRILKALKNYHVDIWVLTNPLNSLMLFTLGKLEKNILDCKHVVMYGPVTLIFKLSY